MLFITLAMVFLATLVMVLALTPKNTVAVQTVEIIQLDIPARDDAYYFVPCTEAHPDSMRFVPAPDVVVETILKDLESSFMPIHTAGAWNRVHEMKDVLDHSYVVR